jgi:uncharacterized coiled-coil DUF342 family protein
MYRIKKKSFWNWLGLYTTEQVKELDERADELWNQLNEAHSTIEAYLPEIEHVANDMDKTERENNLVESSNLFLLKIAIFNLRKCSDNCHDVMFSDEPKRA